MLDIVKYVLISYSELKENYKELFRINKWCRNYVSDWLLY